jgi:UDP-N-acetylmuramyl pentapeptide phosphotransferase/UDP-N-acetylglucosamine-1-phosphate transferase
MKTPILVAAGALWLVALPPLVSWLLKRIGMVRPNFQGDAIPVGYGLVILLWSAPALLLAGRVFADRRDDYLVLLALTAGFGLLGFVDDRWGDRSVGGLKGHLRKFVIEGEITTGFVKLAGGALLAFVVPWRLLHHTWTDALLEGALIALCANAFNLLDLRPGRAGALFLFAAIPTAILAWRVAPAPPLIFVLIPAIVVYERDARARVMLGDTGSNLLGAALGGSIVLLAPSLATKGSLVAALVVLHLIAEKWSLTRIIEKAPVLRTLDRMTGRR